MCFTYRATRLRRDAEPHRRKVLAEGMSEGSDRYDLMSSIPHVNIFGRTSCGG